MSRFLAYGGNAGLDLGMISSLGIGNSCRGVFFLGSESLESSVGQRNGKPANANSMDLLYLFLLIK